MHLRVILSSNFRCKLRLCPPSLPQQVIEQRLLESRENWRLVYKALLLLEYLCKHGPMQVVADLRREHDQLEHLMNNFDYKDSKGRDHGINVRNRAKELLFLIQDPRGLKEARERAACNAGKFVGKRPRRVIGLGWSPLLLAAQRRGLLHAAPELVLFSHCFMITRNDRVCMTSTPLGLVVHDDIICSSSCAGECMMLHARMQSVEDHI